MIACGFRVLFLLTTSSIIPVSLTLRLHFVAHYRGRGDGPKEESLQKMLQRPGGKETDGSGWAGLALELSSLLASSVQLYFLAENTILASYLLICVSLVASTDSLLVCAAACLPACLLGAL